METDWYMAIGDYCTVRETGEHATVHGREVMYGEHWTNVHKPPTESHIGTFEYQTFRVELHNGGVGRFRSDELLRYG